MTAVAPVVAVIRRDGTSLNAIRWAAGYADTRGAPLVVCSSDDDYGSIVADAAMVVVDGDDLDTNVVHRMVDALSEDSTWRISCPITVVRGLPTSDELPLAGAVLVGVDSCLRTEPAIGYAFEEASRRGVELIATHSWVDPGPDALVGDASDCCGTPMGESITLAQSMAGWQELYPDVPVYRHCVHTDPIDAIVTESERAQLIVVGAQPHEEIRSLTSVTHGVVDRARRPVTIVPGRRSHHQDRAVRVPDEVVAD